MRRPLTALLASALAHGSLIVLVLIVVGRGELVPALLVDLEQVIANGDAGTPRRPAPALRSETTGPPRRERAVMRAPVPSPTPPAAERSASAPSESSAPSPAPRPALLEQVPALLPSESVTSATPPRSEMTSAADAIHGRDASPELNPAPGLPEASASGPSSAEPLVAGDSHEGPAAAGGGAPAPGTGPASPGMAAAASASDMAAAGESGGLGTRAGQGLAFAIPGTSGPVTPGVEYGDYLGRLRERIQGVIRYPPAARRRGITGTVHLELVVRPDGAIGSVAVLESSSHVILDEAAVESVRGLRPLPFPADVPARVLRVRLPVVFELR